MDITLVWALAIVCTLGAALHARWLLRAEDDSSAMTSLFALRGFLAAALALTYWTQILDLASQTEVVAVARGIGIPMMTVSLVVPPLIPSRAKAVAEQVVKGVTDSLGG